jgi:heptosyltransferase-2
LLAEKYLFLTVNVLIVKLGATGDVVRTTPLLRRLNAHITWVTAAKNAVLLSGLNENLRCFSWEQRDSARDRKYDLAINLEDALETGTFLATMDFSQLFGAYLGSGGALRYTEDSRRWFDLSLVSVYGKQQADCLKLLNRRTYQELIFDGLGFAFGGEPYVLPEPVETFLSGDVAIAPEAGAVWPMKNWAFFNELKRQLEENGLVVNVLPLRSSLLEHLSDVRNHRCLVGGDSLPMHFALGTGTRCVTLFTCTSPWEIHDYGVQTKIVSTLLEEFFYKRNFDRRATTAISLEQVFGAVMANLSASGPALASGAGHVLGSTMVRPKG